MSTPERVTLAERMEQARVRSVEARLQREGAERGAAKPTSPAAPATSGSPITLKSTLVPFAPKPAPAPAPAAPASRWQVTAQRGEQVMLMPGQMHFSGHAASLRTLLGSCVAITLWHPAKRIGGMCHFLLPSRKRKADDPIDGRYGDEAVEAMLKQITMAKTFPSDYVAHLYGGADTMPEGTSLKFNVGERNIEQGWSLIDRYGFQLQGVDVGEDVPRTVTLTLATGEVDVRRGVGRAPAIPFSPTMPAPFP